MFKKEFKSVKTSYPLRGSDYKRLKEALITRFSLSEEDGELLIPQGLLSAKFVTTTNGSGVALFDRKNVPLWFQIGSDDIAYDKLMPTVYTLWKRTFLPIVTTPQLVVDKLQGGADLMAPGVISVDPSHNTALPLQVDQIVCIRSYSRGPALPPMAVGKMAMSSELLANTDKGKAVLTMHSYGDMLWERGGKGDPPKECTIVQHAESGTQATDELANESSENQVHAPQASDSAIAKEQEYISAPQAGSSSVADLEPVSPSSVDDVLRTALLLYVHLQGPNLALPLSASSLYTDGILAFRPSFLADPSLYTIKQSSHKKLKPLLKSFEKEGILKLKEMSGELNVTSVNLLHDDVQAVRKYRTLADDERKEKNEKAREEEQESAVQPMDIQESWKPHGSTLPLFRAIGASTTDQYSMQMLREDVLSKYITQHSLVHPVERGHFVLDDLLKGILLTRQEKERNEEFMRRDEGLKRLAAACQPWYEIIRDGKRSELRKGTLQPISVSIKMRQGRKAVTLITNYEPFFLAAETMGEELRRICAAQTSVALVNGKANQYEVLVQGKQAKAVMDYLMGKGVPKKWIELEDTTEKKKGK
ncbi:hypothetical protein M408DRAFT_77382 [Serendipita vermifera MAFF 305830]|uniref:SUI1 domain-containing protein n=1 Tax=Serendipita vermifera MAFF 305830 TaxID=933852 RepID=A0A0C3AU55_SERVB|nr:hypothetical protein M408DRAFT_77382 [Serendipita vermifera MAFF 305830]